jgi:SAM-dependent methyltransferase
MRAAAVTLPSRLAARARLRLALLRTGRAYRGVDTTVAPSDGMFKGDLAAYFDVGASALAAIERSLANIDRGAPSTILDFACGHGRVLRFLRAAWPDALITASDVDRHATDFCARQFGAKPVYSREEFEGFGVGGPFDLIWSGSLLSHFDADRWPEVLRFFRRHLANDGVLVFSSHGELAAAILAGAECRPPVPARYGLQEPAAGTVVEQYRRRGFAFTPSPSPTFGLSVASRAWIEREAASAGLRVVRFEPAAWGRHHDVVTCMP